MAHRIVWMSGKLSPIEEWQLRCWLNPHLRTGEAAEPADSGWIGGGTNGIIDFTPLFGKPDGKDPPTPPNDNIPFIGGGTGNSIL